jgi:hypothetical protein
MARHAWPLVVVADADPPHRAGWRSLDRRSPFSDVHWRRPGTVKRLHTARRLACGIQPSAHADDRVPGIHLRDQDRANVTRVRGERCDNPERLPSCPGSAEFHRGSTLPSKVVHARIEASRTRSPGLLRDAPSKGRLGSHPARLPTARSCDRTKSTQRCFGPTSATHISKTSTRVTCGDRLAWRDKPSVRRWVPRFTTLDPLRPACPPLAPDVLFPTRPDEGWTSNAPSPPDPAQRLATLRRTRAIEIAFRGLREENRVP